jgi:hypothetical protein
MKTAAGHGSAADHADPRDKAGLGLTRRARRIDQPRGIRTFWQRILSTMGCGGHRRGITPSRNSLEWICDSPGGRDGVRFDHDSSFHEALRPLMPASSPLRRMGILESSRRAREQMQGNGPC